MRNKFLAQHTIENTHPRFSIDCVILGFHKKKLHVLLNHMERMEYWQLPGGFMFNDENSDAAAYRVLTDRTGLKDVYLKQFHLFSDPKRTVMAQNLDILNPKGKRKRINEQDKEFFINRFISLGYYALVKFDEVTPLPADEITTKWFDVHHLPDLYTDHRHIIETAVEMIRNMIQILPVGYELLPEKFTMSELRKIYEIILEKPLDRRNFQKKVMSSGVLVQLDETKTESSYNAPILYSFGKGKRDTLEWGFEL